MEDLRSLNWAGVPEPKLPKNDLLIGVKVTALNQADHVLQAGLADSVMDACFPVIPGWDVVESVGAGVTEFAAGDEVIGSTVQKVVEHRNNVSLRWRCVKSPACSW